MSVLTTIQQMFSPHYGGRVGFMLAFLDAPLTLLNFSILWSGTPLVTFPRHKSKMCSRVGASIAMATGYGQHMIVSTEKDYENRAVALANSVAFYNELLPDGTSLPRGKGELYELRKALFLSREQSPLFDTVRWTRALEKTYSEVWKRWVTGMEFEESEEWRDCSGPEKNSGCVWTVG